MANERFYENLAIVDSKYNGTANASNFVVPGVEGVDYPVVYELGAEEYSDLNSTGTAVTATTITDGYSLVQTGAAGGTNSLLRISTFSESLVKPLCILSFNAVVNSGVQTIDSYYDGSTYAPLPEGAYTVVSGYNEILIGVIDGYTLTNIDCTVDDYDVDWTNISVKEVTVPPESYLYYFNDEGKVKQLSSTGV